MKRIDGLTFLEYLQNKILLLDGATGTALIRHGMAPGVCPELYALENPQALADIQRAYIEAGSRALYTFTMGANALKLKSLGLEREAHRLNAELAALTAKVAGSRAFVGGDVSATGVFLTPTGDLEFEQAVDIYKEQVRALSEGGADFIVIETMIDIRETRAAVIAAKEACDLPVVASMTFAANGRTLTGTTAAAAAITLISSGADAVGLNCSTGPAEMVPLVAEMKRVASVPVIVKPNAGMPRIENGETRFDLSCEAFRQYIKPLCEAGANLIGGCCGTDPDYIRAIAEEAQGLQPIPWNSALPPALTSVSDEICFGRPFRVIGDRIGSDGDPRLREALESDDYYTVLDMALDQRDNGAHILRIDTGLPEVDEKDAMKQAVEMICVQAKMPVCAESAHADAIEQALRICPGRALVRPLLTQQLPGLLPVIQKYHAMLILPPAGSTAEQRIMEIKSAYEAVRAASLDKQDLLADCVVKPDISGAADIAATIETVRWCADNGFYSVLDISGDAFGLPEEKYARAARLAAIMTCGLSAVILNPADKPSMDVCRAAEKLADGGAALAQLRERLSGGQIGEAEAADIIGNILR
jgi:5-methyltetrahydrofolate--homocysteine methyltransferase